MMVGVATFIKACGKLLRLGAVLLLSLCFIIFSLLWVRSQYVQDNLSYYSLTTHVFRYVWSEKGFISFGRTETDFALPPGWKYTAEPVAPSIYRWWDGFGESRVLLGVEYWH